jgi:hypothetical protein
MLFETAVVDIDAVSGDVVVSQRAERPDDAAVPRRLSPWRRSGGRKRLWIDRQRAQGLRVAFRAMSWGLEPRDRLDSDDAEVFTIEQPNTDLLMWRPTLARSAPSREFQSRGASRFA